MFWKHYVLEFMKYLSESFNIVEMNKVEQNLIWRFE